MEHTIPFIVVPVYLVLAVSHYFIRRNWLFSSSFIDVIHDGVWHNWKWWAHWAVDAGPRTTGYTVHHRNINILLSIMVPVGFPILFYKWIYWTYHRFMHYYDPNSPAKW